MVAIVGDVHLHLRKYPEFEAKRFTQLIAKLAVSKTNTIIFSGDLLDHARPTLEEIQLLNSQLKLLKDSGKTVYIISGNHENVTKESSTYDYIVVNAIYVKDLEIGKIRMLGWDTIKSKQYPKSLNKSVLITHLRCNIGLIQEEYPILELSTKYNIVFMGDIHQRYSPYNNVHYTSSPYSTKFSNKPISGYGYIELDSSTLAWKYIDLDLPSKVKRICKFKDIKKVLKGLEKHLVKLEVSGTTAELQSLVDTNNVLYVKQIELESLSVLQCTKSSDALDGLIDYVVDTEVMKGYDNYEQKVKTKIQEMR